jgi:hypothetical protein
MVEKSIVFSLYLLSLLSLFLGIEGAEVYYNVNGLRVGLRNNSQTIGFLAQQGDTTGFSFTPDDK